MKTISFRGGSFLSVCFSKDRRWKYGIVFDLELVSVMQLRILFSGKKNFPDYLFNSSSVF